MRRTGPAAAAVLLGLALTACVDERPALDPPASSAPPSPPAASPTASPAAPDVALPDGALRDLVPRAEEVPAPLVPLLQASGPRELAAVAEFSSDPAAAQAGLTAHGFTDAYVAQHAAPGDPRSLTTVVVRFATADGARADLDGDLAAAGGEVVEADVVGEASQVRRLDLPGSPGTELVTVRFRQGATTWLVAWRATRPADARVPVGLARRLAERG